MNMVERAARALCENPSEDPDEMIMMMNGEMWPRWRAEVWRVEAVLNAMRAPTDEMSIAGGQCRPFMYETDLCRNRPGRIIANSVWEAMIDEALAN